MDRRLRRGEVIAALSAAIRRRTSDEMVAASAAAKVNVAKINTVGRAAQDPQLQAAPMRMEAVPPVTWKIYAERALSVEACTCGACGASGGGGWRNSIP